MATILHIGPEHTEVTVGSKLVSPPSAHTGRAEKRLVPRECMQHLGFAEIRWTV